MGGLDGAVILGRRGGLQAALLPYGATVAHLWVPDRRGNVDDVVLGVADYAAAHPYFGGVIGRYANRIRRGRFILNGKIHQLVLNDGVNTLHGGGQGFSRRLWITGECDQSTARFGYRSEDGEEGFPGALFAEVTYSISDDELRLDYKATSAEDTILNLTNHSYFNLKGGGTILDHSLWIDADAYTPVDETLIPTGELAPVEGTPFDFREPTPIQARIWDTHPQLRIGRGYDHNWVLNGGVTKDPRPVATLSERSRGRSLTVLTTQPGLQFYAGTQLDGTFGYPQFGGAALETQHFPDSPNQPHFPSTVLRRGEVFSSTTIWRFAI